MHSALPTDAEKIADVPGMPLLAELKTPDGAILIQERRRTPRADGTPREDVPARDGPAAIAPNPLNSPQMMALGGLIIIGVLVASYTTKYDAAVGHAGGVLPVPVVGFLALQLFLARAALRLYDDVHNFPALFDFAVSRAFRYLPAVVPAVLLGYAVAKLGGVPGLNVEARQLPANLLMLTDMIGDREIDSSHWRLKIELIQAVLVGAAWFGPARRHLPALLTLGLLVTALSIDGEPARHSVLTFHGFMTSDGYLPLFVYGVALYHFSRDTTARVWLALMGASAALAFMSNTPSHGTAIVAGLMVLTLIAFGRLRWLGAWKWLAHLGQLAFPIYVVHYVIGFSVIHKLEALGIRPIAAILVAALVAIALGKALNALFERPLQTRGAAFTAALRTALRQAIPAFAFRPNAAPVVE